jgi:hypothetical protein
VAPAGEQLQIFFGFGNRAGFGEDSRACGNNRIGGNDESLALDKGQLFGSEAQRVLPWQFPGKNGFVDTGCDDLAGLNADLPEKFQPPRAGGSKNYLKRNVIRPLERS